MVARKPTWLKAAITLSPTYTRDSGWLESNQFLGTCYVNFRVAIDVCPTCESRFCSPKYRGDRVIPEKFAQR